MRRDDGFTLIELMVTVCIIGLLAALAIPSYRAFLARSRQVEARDNLDSIHTLEISYHGENDRFGNLIEVGFVPEAGTHYEYCIAVSARPRAGECILATAPLDFGGSGSVSGGNFYTAAGAASVGGARGNPHFDRTSFEADAYGTISDAAAPYNVDEWLIDQSKTLVNYVVGY